MTAYLQRALDARRIKLYARLADAGLAHFRGSDLAGPGITPTQVSERWAQLLARHQESIAAWRQTPLQGWAPPFVAEVLSLYLAGATAALGMTPFRSQLIAALALAEGRAVQMATGEGKTLAAPLAAILFGLRGLRTHVVTANEYLAQRDANAMAPLYAVFGLTGMGGAQPGVAVALQGQDDRTRRAVYAHQVVYTTAHVLALDRLHDDLVVHPGMLRMARGPGESPVRPLAGQAAAFRAPSGRAGALAQPPFGQPPFMAHPGSGESLTGGSPGRASLGSAVHSSAVFISLGAPGAAGFLPSAGGAGGATVPAFGGASSAPSSVLIAGATTSRAIPARESALSGHAGGFLAHTAAIIDEIDQVLIDEARAPVVYAAPHEGQDTPYDALLALARALERTTSDAPAEGDFLLDLEDRMAVLTDRGYENATRLMREQGLLLAEDGDYGARHQRLLVLLARGLGALHLLKRGVHYLVQDDALVLIDSLTGRLLPGKRWDAGLHQMLQAKEGLALSPEETILGRITLQSYFQLYGALSGMSGTVLADAQELHAMYGLAAVQVPRNVPPRCQHLPDVFCRTQAGKIDRLVKMVTGAHDTGRPVLVAVASTRQAEEVTAALQKAGLLVRTLSAANHSQEAQVFSRAGELGAITVATSLAGRGVDIRLGGDARGMYEILKADFEQGGGKGAKEGVKANVAGHEIQQVRAEAQALTAGQRTSLESAPDSRHLSLYSQWGQALFDGTRELARLVHRLDLDDPVSLAARKLMGDVASSPLVWQANAPRFVHPLGLLVIGFEHFESLRADEQMRGRAGRQGDPGETVFLSAMDDTLLADGRLGEEMRKLLAAVGAGKDDPLEERLTRKMLVQAQREASGRAASARAQLMSYESVFEEQRLRYQAIREQFLTSGRDEVALLRVTQLLAQVAKTAEQVLEREGDAVFAERYKGLLAAMGVRLARPGETREELPAPDAKDEDADAPPPTAVDPAWLSGLGKEEFVHWFLARLQERRQASLAGLKVRDRATFERYRVLQHVDAAWVRHLEAMAVMRQGIHLRGHAKRNPVFAFVEDGYARFEEFVVGLAVEVALAVIRPLDHPESGQAGKDASS